MCDLTITEGPVTVLAVPMEDEGDGAWVSLAIDINDEEVFLGNALDGWSTAQEVLSPAGFKQFEAFMQLHR
jgi:hypothetical protein